MENVEKDLVSIIIPVYNVAPYLDRCMKSVFGQSYSHLEIILVDDGATDESGIMCDEYAMKDSRIVVIHQENRGLSAARNAGTLASKGNYICFVDPDDEINECFVEILHEAMILYDVSLAMCAFVSVFEQKHQEVLAYPCEAAVGSKKNIFMITADEYVNNYVEYENASATAWSRMYSSELARSILFPEGRVYEDLATHIEYAICATKIAIVTHPLYKHYLQRTSSITSTMSEQNLKDNYWAHLHVYEQIVRYDPQYLDRAKKIVYEASLAILINIYSNYGEVVCRKMDKTFIHVLRSNIKEYLFWGKSHGFRLCLQIVLLLMVPHLFPVLRRIKNRFRRVNNNEPS